jgi:hypothetical protein
VFHEEMVPDVGQPSQPGQADVAIRALAFVIEKIAGESDAKGFHGIPPALPFRVAAKQYYFRRLG